MLQHKVHDSACVLLQNALALQVAGDYVGALGVLNVIAPRDLRQNPVELSEYYYLLAFCLFKHGRHTQALPRVRAAIRLCQKTAEHTLFARQKQLLGRIYLRLGRNGEALDMFLEGYVARKRAGDFAGLYGSLANIGLSHLVVGDVTAATETFHRALCSAEKYNGRQQVILGKLNMCVALMLHGDFRAHQGIVESLRGERLGVEETAHVSMHAGQAAVWLLRHEEAETDLKQAYVTYMRRKTFRDYVVCLEFLGMNEYFAGNYAKAKEYYQQVLAMPEPTASAVAQTLRMLVDVYVAECDWKNAKETAVKAEQAITKINERIELAALWRAQAQIAEHECDHAAARDFFQKSIDLLQQCGARYELALTHFAAGQSIVYSTAARLEHLQQAKTLFVDMDVPKRVLQVEKAMMGLREKAVARKRSIDSYGIIEAPTIIGQSEPIKDLLSRATKFAEREGNILITGETGTGKDLLAQYVHAMSPRSSRPFIVVNSASIPESLLEAELFGACKGSYSGAEKDRVGLIAQADGGSFFFDEISETPLSLQAKLLRVIETKEVRRVGENRDRRYDVRFIAATNCDLEERVRTGLFREDLFYRLRRGHLHIPPLRERNGDLPLLVHHFLFRSGFGDYRFEQVAFLVEVTGCDRHHWPGNVRELEGMIDDAATVCSSKLIMDLVPAIRDILIRHSKNDPQYPERAELVAALERNSGNQTKAANDLGIAASTFRDRLKKNGII